MQEQFDIIVAGGGIAGVLTAARILNTNPALRILLLEKHGSLGGRILTRDVQLQSSVWGYGLNALSPELYDFFDQTLKNDPECFDLPSLVHPSITRLGILSGGKLSVMDLGDVFAKKGLKTIGGGAALKDLPALETIDKSLASADFKDQPLSSVWPGNKKSSTLIALDPVTRWLGITDLWSASVRATFAKLNAIQKGMRLGHWQDAIKELTQRFLNSEHLQVRTLSAIIQCKYEDNAWEVVTSQGTFSATSLIVAQPPWEAIDWLDKPYWPAKLLNFALKAKPTSVVVLTEDLQSCPEDLPEFILIPAEQVQVVINRGRDICYQVTLDYEVSLQAPDVVKNVKSLKRARKKLKSYFPGITTTNEHLALVPVGWSGPSAHADFRYFEKLDTQEINTFNDNLFFCGDAYGNAICTDDNLIRSVIIASESAARKAAQPMPTVNQNTNLETPPHDSSNY